MLPPRLAVLVWQLRDQDEPRSTLGRLGTPAVASASPTTAKPRQPEAC
jgi:hypothetical protein